MNNLKLQNFIFPGYQEKDKKLGYEKKILQIGPTMMTVTEFLVKTMTDNLNLYKIIHYIETSRITHKVSIFYPYYMKDNL